MQDAEGVGRVRSFFASGDAGRSVFCGERKRPDGALCRNTEETGRRVMQEYGGERRRGDSGVATGSQRWEDSGWRRGSGLWATGQRAVRME